MTTAFARRKWDKIELVSDKLLTGGFKGKYYGEKIYVFNNGSAIVNAWNHIPNDMYKLLELKPDPVSIRYFISEHNPDWECIFIDNETFKMYFISKDIIEPYDDFISIGSGYQAAYIQYLMFGNTETPNKMMENIAKVDNRTSEECEVYTITDNTIYNVEDLPF